MKKTLSILIGLLFFILSVKSQSKYLYDILTKAALRTEQGHAVIGANYWRYDTCLYSKQMCRYNTSTGINVKMYDGDETITCELLRSNNSGYQSKNPYDTFKYVFVPQNINTSQLIRKLLIKDSYIRTDTFNLTVVDTLLFDNYSLIKKVFGKAEIEKQKGLKIYVLRSVDNIGSVMLHYWVERIGIIKLADEKCWRYSFEMNDDRDKSIEKMFAGIMKLIKTKYKDPYWLSDPCGVEQ